MAEESSKTHDVFLSHSSKDKTWADAACAVLERHRIRCWIAPRDVTPGEEWAAGIMKGLNDSRIMVLIFSGHANASDEVRREVERAATKGMFILPVRVEDVEPEGAMEYALGNRHWLDAFTPPVEQQLDEVAQSVKKLLGRPEPGPPSLGVGPKVDTETRRPRAFGRIAIGAALLGLVALGVIVTTMQKKNGETKTTVSENPPERVVRHDKGHANPAADSSGAKPPILPPPTLDRVLPEEPVRLTVSKTTASGLVYSDVKEGLGETPKTGQTCIVHYSGWLWENNAKGNKFDSSLDRDKPFDFQLGKKQVIAGWDEGVSTMKVGGIRQLLIPPDLGYGARGAGRGVIPPNATLFFEIKLLEVE